MKYSESFFAIRVLSNATGPTVALWAKSTSLLRATPFLREEARLGDKNFELEKSTSSFLMQLADMYGTPSETNSSLRG